MRTQVLDLYILKKTLLMNVMLMWTVVILTNVLEYGT